MPRPNQPWTNESVRAFAGGQDPVARMIQVAREVVMDALDKGWSGPPFDPIRLAEYRKLDVVAKEDVRDARTVPTERDRLRIEFNPNRPLGRTRYSVAHEIAHTLFPDCADYIRHRASYHELEGDQWQLEALCNIGAAEFVMPIGSMPTISYDELSIDRLMELRAKYEVSPEALLIRAVRVTDYPCAMFCASRIDSGPRRNRYRVDYAIPSPAWNVALDRGWLFSEKSVVQNCTAIEFTAKGVEAIGSTATQVHLEAVGIPPYPGSSYPRVAGVCRTVEESPSTHTSITYLTGDALEPQPAERRLLLQIVNDTTPNWGGGGFAQAVRSKWPAVQDEFRTWAAKHTREFTLGGLHRTAVDETLSVISLIAQHRYGPSTKPRIRYSALEKCLRNVASIAVAQGASVHMPRIGTGQAGGSWHLIEELIRTHLCGQKIPVFVYDLPTRQRQQAAQAILEL